MTVGAGGVYEIECEMLRERIGGSVVLLVLGGRRGSGFSVMATGEALPPSISPSMELCARWISHRSSRIRGCCGG